MKRWFGLCLGILLLLGATACGNKAPTWQEQYDLGIRYLNDGDYEEAVIAFTAAIEIDPMQVDTYYALANTYIAQNDFEQAREILVKGVEKTGAQKLQDLIDAIDSGNIVDYWGTSAKWLDMTGMETYYGGMSTPMMKNVSLSLLPHMTAMEIKPVRFFLNLMNMEIKSSAHHMIREQALSVAMKASMMMTETKLSLLNITKKGKIESRTANEYDEVGNCIKTSYYDSDGSLNQYYLFSYDANGNAIREDSYNADGQLSWYHVNEYDAAGNQIKVTSYDSENRFQGYTIRSYNNRGQVVDQKGYSSDGTLIEHYVHTYAENGMPIRRDYYDDQGNLVLSESYN